MRCCPLGVIRRSGVVVRRGFRRVCRSILRRDGPAFAACSFYRSLDAPELLFPELYGCFGDFERVFLALEFGYLACEACADLRFGEFVGCGHVASLHVCAALLPRSVNIGVCDPYANTILA